MKPDNYPDEPAELWEHFYQITQIPRPSGEEDALRSYIIKLAERAGHSWKLDAAGNLVVYAAGSEGRGGDAPVIIQNHLDMVTVKTDDKDHDFSVDALTLQVQDGWLLADRITISLCQRPAGATGGTQCGATRSLAELPARGRCRSGTAPGTDRIHGRGNTGSTAAVPAIDHGIPPRGDQLQPRAAGGAG